MPILKPEKLILVDAKQIEVLEKIDGQRTGAKITKWKYTFLKEDGTLKLGYDNNGIYKDDVQIITNGWDDEKAKNYFFELSEFNGQTKEKLFTGKLPKYK